MKNVFTCLSLTLVLFLLEGCCTSYCAECQSCELVQVEFVDSITGDIIQDSIPAAQFTVISKKGNDTSVESYNTYDVKIDMSIARKKRMSDELEFKWSGQSLGEVAVDYKLNGDDSCCDFRSVKIKELEAVSSNIEVIKSENDYMIRIKI